MEHSPEIFHILPGTPCILFSAVRRHLLDVSDPQRSGPKVQCEVRRVGRSSGLTHIASWSVYRVNRPRSEAELSLQFSTYLKRVCSCTSTAATYLRLWTGTPWPYAHWNLKCSTPTDVLPTGSLCHVTQRSWQHSGDVSIHTDCYMA